MANLSEKEREAYPAREGVAESNPKQHSRCMKKLEHAMQRSKCSGDFLEYGIDTDNSGHSHHNYAQ